MAAVNSAGFLSVGVARTAVAALLALVVAAPCCAGMITVSPAAASSTAPCHDSQDDGPAPGACPLLAGFDRIAAPEALVPMGSSHDAPAAITAGIAFPVAATRLTPLRRALPPLAAAVPLFLLHLHLLI